MGHGGYQDTKCFSFQNCLGVVDKDLVLFNIGVEGLDIDHFCLAQNIERASQNDGIFFRSDHRTVDIGALPADRKSTRLNSSH